jgi:hypothetical protein
MGLFVGPSGDGKKCAAATFSKLGPLVYLDFDMRIRGLLGCSWVDRTNIDYNSYPTKNDVTVFERLNKDLDQLYNSWRAGQCKYKTIVLSSITGASRGLLQDSLTITYKGQDGRMKDISRTLGPLKIAGMENFRFINNGVMQILSFLQSLPLNIIVIGHTVPVFEAKDPDDPFSERVAVGHKLAMSDTLGALIPGLFDNVFRFERKITGSGNSVKIKFMVEFRGQLSRTTYNSLPDGQIDITGKNFYDLIQGYLEPKDAKKAS